jgi:superfamily II DNA or RNA helicase
MHSSKVGILMGRDHRYRPTAPVQVASIDTLRNRQKPRADIVFTDEAHRALSRTHLSIAAHYDQAIHLGLTATPFRADGRGLGDAYDELLLVASPRQLIGEGYLVEPRVLTVPSNALPDLASVRMRGGDYEEGALADAVDRKALVGNIVEHWHKHAEGVRTVAFAVSVAHSKHIVARFREAGVAAEHLDGMTPAVERDAILARLERGETLVVGSVSVLAEGWDQASAKCAILARPTKSTGLYLQQAGRILRPWNDQQAIILDHAGCALEHGLPHDDREFSLEGKARGAAKEEPQLPRVRVCEQCYAVLPAALQQCPECGAATTRAANTLREVGGELLEVTESPLIAQRAEWDRLCTFAAARGYKPGWARYRFKELFGHAPPRSFPAPCSLSAPQPMSDDSKRALFAQMLADEGSVGWAALKYRLEIGSAPPSQNATTGGAQ